MGEKLHCYQNGFVENPLKNENDIYFGIACTILSYNKKKQFIIDDIIKELKETDNWPQEVFEKWNIEKMIKVSIKNLIEHGKIIEEARWYELCIN